tara:strand:+ start:7779 stop:9572 length:1794 start_codon:yes stop_codon:yes gene_type:complete
MKMNADPTADYNRLVSFSDFLQSPVIEDQSKYSVGVKRFKIPITNIDLFRIYENTATLGLVPFARAEGKYSIINNGEAEFPADMFDITAWNNDDIDINLKDAPHDKTNVAGRYIPIHSQIEFAQMLTRTLAKRSNPSATNNRAGALISTATIANVAVNSNGQWTTLNSIPARTGAVGRTQLTSWSCGLNYWSPKTTGASATNDNANLHSPRDLQFRLVVDLGGALPIIVYLGEGMFPSIKNASDWVSKFNFSADGTNQKSFGFSSTAVISYERAKFNEGGYRIGNVGGIKNHREFHINSYDDLDLLLRNYSGKTFTFQVRDNANYGTGAGMVGALGDYATNMSGYLTLVEDKFSGNDGEGDMEKYVEFFPRFEWNDTTNKIEFLSTAEFHSQFSVYANSGLLNMVDFPVSQRVNAERLANGRANLANDTYETIFKKYVYSDLTPVGNEVCGGLLTFRNNTNTFTDRNVNNPVAPTTIVSYAELSSSIWKRRFLYGLEFTTNRLAVLGEVGSGGNNRKKILTDFEIDPANTGRDYLLYSPSGNAVRYYKLGTDQPLNAVDCSVFYTDMLGFSHPLIINNNLCASIKLEFKPNNQISNY